MSKARARSSRPPPAAGCLRIVYTSTVGCIGLPEPIDGRIIPSDEATPVREEQMANHYKRSKWQAEQVAIRLARDGLPVIIVNPTAPVGPRDVKPTPTGKVIVDFLNRRMPAYLDTGLNWVHVRDVAIGHILAAEKGCIGERYILGNAEGNWTMKQAFAVLEEVTGVRAPKMADSLLGGAGRGVCRRGPFAVDAPAAESAAGRRAHGPAQDVFNPAKAIRELGLPQTPPKQALADAAEWFRQNGYVK